MSGERVYICPECACALPGEVLCYGQGTAHKPRQAEPFVPLERAERAEQRLRQVEIDLEDTGARLARVEREVAMQHSGQCVCEVCERAREGSE